MGLAMEYIKTIRKPEVHDFDDLLGSVIAVGLGVKTPAERKSVQNNVGSVIERHLADILEFEFPNIEGADLSSDGYKVIVEVKNRHNTLNAGGKERVKVAMKRLTGLHGRFHGYEKFLVIVHPRTAGHMHKLGNGITEISAARFCHTYGVNFRKEYLRLVREVAAFYGVDVPTIPKYYDDVVFKVRKRTRRRRKNLTPKE